VLEQSSAATVLTRWQVGQVVTHSDESRGCSTLPLLQAAHLHALHCHVDVWLLKKWYARAREQQGCCGPCSRQVHIRGQCILMGMS
jgi:hypothetical protein